MMNIEVREITQGCAPSVIDKGDWIDLYTDKEYTINKGDFCLIHLGVAMQLPKYTEAILAMRSSTFKRYGIIQTNGIGVIDNSYCGNDDEWCVPVYATRDIVIPSHERIAQFRLFDNQNPVAFTLVDNLNNKNRGGFGSTNK